MTTEPESPNQPNTEDVAPWEASPPTRWQASPAYVRNRLVPWTQWFLAEAWAVISATASQTWRLAKYGSSVAKYHMLRRRFHKEQLALGELMYREGEGDDTIRTEIARLDEEIAEARAVKRSSTPLVTRRTMHLAALAESSPAVPQTQSDVREKDSPNVFALRCRLGEAEGTLRSQRATLLPSDGRSRRRIAIGFGAVLLAAIGYAATPPKRPASDSSAAVVGLQTESEDAPTDSQRVDRVRDQDLSNTHGQTADKPASGGDETARTERTPAAASTKMRVAGAVLLGNEKAEALDGFNRTIYAVWSEGEDESYVAAFSLEGRQKWKTSIAGVLELTGYQGIPRYRGCVGHDGTVFLSVGAPRRYIIAIAPDGTKKWTFPAAGTWELTTDQSGNLYCAGNAKTENETVYGVLVAIDSEGKKKWQVTVGEPRSHAFPSIGPDGGVFAAGRDAEGFQCLWAITSYGEKKWHFTPETRLSMNLFLTGWPVFARDGTVYAGFDRTLYAIGPDGGKKWELPIGRVRRSAVGSAGTLIVHNDVSDLYAISPQGEKLWKTHHEADFGPLVDLHGCIYMDSGTSRVTKFSPQGQIAQQIDIPFEGKANYCLTLHGGDVLCVGLRNGKVWRIACEAQEPGNTALVQSKTATREEMPSRHPDPRPNQEKATKPGARTDDMASRTKASGQESADMGAGPAPVTAGTKTKGEETAVVDGAAKPSAVVSPAAVLFEQATAYRDGRGVAADERKAIDLFRQSADAGYGPAMHALAQHYEAKKDYHQAEAWNSMAVKQGVPEAMTDLGYQYDPSFA